MKKARAKKTGLNLMIVHFYIRRKLDMLDIIFQYGKEQVLIYRILIGFEVIRKIILFYEIIYNKEFY